MRKLHYAHMDLESFSVMDDAGRLYALWQYLY